MIKRYQDWAVKLNNFIESNTDRKFERGVFDCTVFAGLAVKEMTGKDFVEKYIGVYKTKKEGFELLKKEGIKDLIDLTNKCLGKPYQNVNFAKRGDVVAIKHEKELALGIVDLTGRRAVTTGKEGLFYFDKKHWLIAWGV